MRITFLLPVLFTFACGTDREGPNTNPNPDPDPDPNPTDPTGTPTPQPGKDPTVSSIPSPDAGDWGSGSDGSGTDGSGSSGSDCDAGTGSGSDGDYNCGSDTANYGPGCEPPGCEESWSRQNATAQLIANFSCDAPKVLICHIPPGNPSNMHTICVGASAVEPHQTLHGDSIGACPDETCPEPGDYQALDPNAQ